MLFVVIRLYYCHSQGIYGEDIATIEMLNILLAINVWCTKWATSSVRIACDNEAVVKVLNSGHTKCHQLAKIARYIFMSAATHDLDVTIVHIPEESRMRSQTFCLGGRVLTLTRNS